MTIRLRELAALLGCLAFATSSAHAEPTPQQKAEDSLSSRSECVYFRWIKQSHGDSDHGGIAVPITLNGQDFWFQLDTGADLDVIYGNIADRAGWRKPDERIFKAHSLQVASARFDRPRVVVESSMRPDTNASGTLGLAELIGKVVAIDYPGKRFCIFDHADVPQPLWGGKSADAELRNAKLFLPVSGGGFSSDAMVFDTGSSQFPVLVDSTNWITLTALSGPSTAVSTVTGNAWGKTVEWKGDKAVADIFIGPIKLGRPVIYTRPDQPKGFASWPFKADGVIGNASFEKDIVVLDLTEWMTFSVIQ
ncbi:MAG: pepsin/retropepsin-like aspartic protease family protein [Caulobacteraceae bacterium]